MLPLQESNDRVNWVPIQGLSTACWKPHANDLVREVGQVKVETVLDVPHLILRDKTTQKEGHYARPGRA